MNLPAKRDKWDRAAERLLKSADIDNVVKRIAAKLRAVDRAAEKRGRNSITYDDVFISDGFGGTWSAFCPECKKRTMQIVRPGKVQCGHCV